MCLRDLNSSWITMIAKIFVSVVLILLSAHVSQFFFQENGLNTFLFEVGLLKSEKLSFAENMEQQINSPDWFGPKLNDEVDFGKLRNQENISLDNYAQKSNVTLLGKRSPGQSNNFRFPRTG